MANTVISVIQPGGSSGSKYNMRATGLRYFPTNSSATAQTPTDGYVSLYNQTSFRIACTDITELWSGMTLSFEMPVASTSAATSGSLQINSLGSNTLKLKSGLPLKSLTAGDLCIVEYDGTSWWLCDDLKAGTSSSAITSGANTVPTSGAVYDYVSNMVTNRWEYVVCPAQANEIPAGAVYYDGTTTVAGTMAAGSGTEYKIYLVRHDHDTEHGNTDAYDEWITVKTGTSPSFTYSWEKIGNTDISTTDIANRIVDTIIGSIADHTYVKPTGSGSVTVGTHDHTFNGASMTSTGNFTPQGSISVNPSSGSGTSYTPEGTIGVGGSDGTTYTPAGSVTVGVSGGTSYTPAGTVLSTFAGTPNYVSFSGTQATISMSASNVTTGNQSANGVTINLSTAATTPDGYVGVKPNVSVSGSGTVSTDTSDTTHSHAITNVPVSVSAVNGGSFTVSTQNGQNVTISSTTASENDNTFQVPISSASVTTQPAFSVGSSGTHTHSVTTTASTGNYGTLSSVGTASSYTVSNEVLTLTPSTVPGTTVSVDIPALSGTAAADGDHIHALTQTANTAISVTGGYVKLTATTPNHSHTLSGSVTPIGTANGNTATDGSHHHNVSFGGSNIASALSASIEKINIKGTIADHTHTIASLSLSTNYTPSGTLSASSTTSTGAADVTPAGTVTSGFSGTATSLGFSGTATKLSFSGTEKKLAFSGTQGSVSVTGTTTGSIADTDLGNKTVTVGTENATLHHVKVS